jgi:mannosyltransferase OCH1-like enzyme
MVQVYADDEAARDYIQDRWPHALAAYDSLIPGAFKSDLWRLLVLHDFGGVYADLGFLFTAPMHPNLVDFSQDELVLVIDVPMQGRQGRHQEGLYQAFMAAYPRHPVVLAMIETLLENIVAQEYGDNILDITGPAAVARAVRAFFRTDGGVAPAGVRTTGVHADAFTVGRHVFWAMGRAYRVSFGALVVDHHQGNYVVGPNSQGARMLYTKFPQYDRVMYAKRGVAHYSHMYHQRSVFQAPAQFLTYDQFASRWPGPEPGSVRLPRILWRTGWFHPGHLPPSLVHAMGSFTTHAPEWVQVYCTDDDQLAFLKAHYPDAVRAWQSLRPGAFRADLWRLLIVLHYGGLYVDLPQVLLVPLHTVVDPDKDQFVSALDRPGSAPCLYQAILGAYPQHPLVRAMADHVLSNVRRRSYGRDPLDVTGPMAVAQALMAHVRATTLPPVGRSLVVMGKHEKRRRGRPFTPSLPSMPSMRITLLHHVGAEQVLGLDNKTQVLRTKFPGAHEVLYPPQREPHYGILWRNRQVYRMSHGHPEK